MPADVRRASIEELKDIVCDLISFVHGNTRPDRLVISIPPRPDHDWDFLLMEALNELEQLRAAQKFAVPSYVTR